MIKKTKQLTYWIEPTRDKKWTKAAHKLRIANRAELIFRAVEEFIQ